MVSVEHSFGRFGSLAASYYPRRQFHELDSLNLNAPLPVTGVRSYDHDESDTSGSDSFPSNSYNPGPPVGILTSPFFGKSISLNSPFSNNTAANRAITLRAAFFF
ncbi:MAG: hypothetical protein WB439_07245 [Acidobacteriaceae bacterium]